MLSPSFVEAIKPLFSNLDFVVTGGVDTTEENIKSWFKAGVCGVGMGTKLISKAVLENGDFEKLKTTTKAVLEIIKKINQRNRISKLEK